MGACCSTVKDKVQETVHDARAHRGGTAEYTGFMARWMAETQDKIKDVLLKDLRIPGTHDSFTASILAPVACGWMVCQETSTQQQLAMGVRYFDCRIKCDRGVFWTAHGLLSDQFEPILREMRAFLDHAGCDKEILIVDMSHFEGFQTNDGPRLRQLVHDVFGEKLVPKDIDLNTTTVGSLWATPGRVVALFDGNDTDGLVMTDGWAGSDYPATDGVAYSINGKGFLVTFNRETKEWVIREVARTDGAIGEKTDSGTWDVGYEILTPYAVGPRTFVIACDTETNSYLIHALLENGKLGPETHKGQFPKPSMCFRAITTADNRGFLYAGSSAGSPDWSLIELTLDGQLGGPVASGQWSDPLAVQLPYSAENRIFVFRYSVATNHYAISEVKVGAEAAETASGDLPKRCQSLLPLDIDMGRYFIGLSPDDKAWFVHELRGDGTLGDEQIHGFLKDTRVFAVANGSFGCPLVMQHMAKKAVWRSRTIHRVEAPHVWTRQRRSGGFVSFWPNKGDLNSLVEANKEVLATMAPQRAGDKLFVLQCQVTAPEEGFPQWLLQNRVQTLHGFAEEVNAHYKQFFRSDESLAARINIVIADYVDEDYCRALINPYLPQKQQEAQPAPPPPPPPAAPVPPPEPGQPGVVASTSN